MSEDIQEVSEILDTVSTKIPKLITGLIDTLYSPEAGKKMGQSVGAMYKELVDSGIPAEDALAMAKEYMISMKSVMSNVKM
ncbi:MAG: hypothetical protein FWD71_14080 [Oscillospiraceae bacterium]|nr:hypothetical protein [Oscillospiraceae bacterium]